jgi:nucleoside triphosphate pyrophosphatase
LTLRPVVLASASPRRRQLLAQFGFDFEVRPAHTDETPRPGEPPIRYVERVAREKAAAVARPGELVIAADTTVDVGGEILGKPVDDHDARRMLRRLSGRDHDVHTGVALVVDGRLVSTVETTAVSMTAISEGQIDWYVATGEPGDKAGGYALQGIGGIFVTSVVGSVSNVVGLPLSVLVRLCGDQEVELF